MALLVLKTHRALYFGGGVNERAQRVAGQRVVVAASIDIFELARLVVGAFRVLAFEKKTFDLVCRLLLEKKKHLQPSGVTLVNALNDLPVRHPPPLKIPV